MNYAEPLDEDGGEVFKPLSANATNDRALKRRKVSAEESSDPEFDIDPATEVVLAGEGTQ